jgi:hypothetical protein
LGNPTIVKGIVTESKLVDYFYVPNVQTSKLPTRVGLDFDESISPNLGLISSHE